MRTTGRGSGPRWMADDPALDEDLLIGTAVIVLLASYQRKKEALTD
jgi:hypothetical protein